MSVSIDKLDAKGYRDFGLITSAILVVVFGLLIPWLFNLTYVYWPWIIGAILTTLALLIPLALQPIYMVWMKFGNVMGWINTRIILGILFYAMFLPIGLIMRILGKDPMARKWDKTVTSYRVISKDESKDNVERPY